MFQNNKENGLSRKNVSIFSLQEVDVLKSQMTSLFHTDSDFRTSSDGLKSSYEEH